MPRSSLSRPLVALASLALASAALVAAPAQAATPSGITRDMVLTGATGLRASYETGLSPSAATVKAIRAILNRACAVSADDGEALTEINAIPTTAGASADGLLVYGRIGNFDTSETHDCVAGVVASVDPGRVLSGSATLTAKTNPGAQSQTVTAQLTGDVAATPAISTVGGGSITELPTFTASGAATLTTKIPAKTVKDKKTKAEKKAAAKKYTKKLKALKKSYAKALKRAGSSKSKKAAATKAYVARKKAAKAAYRYAIANYRIVKKARTTQDVRPFSTGLVLL